MNFMLSEDQVNFQQTVQHFVRNEMAPYAKEWDEKHIFPVLFFKKAAALGLGAINVRESIGGSQLSRLDSALIFEELATACPSTAAYLSIHNMVASLIDQFASNDLREKWLPRIISMDCLTSYCLTEPGSGSDAASLKTTATREESHYVLNGSKAFISGGSAADLYVCMVRTGEAGPKGISCLLVEKNQPGLTFGKKEMKLGWHSQPTTMIFFENCKVPISNQIGDEGKGFNIALSALNGGRINIAACSLGGAKACLQLTHQYMQERVQFNRKLKDFEALQFKYADMLTEFEAARSLVHKAALSLDNKHPHASMYCAMAKRFATDHCFHVADRALQMFGGYGYLSDYPIERYFRDLRVHQILEGTNEIMRLIIAKSALEENFTIE